MQSNFKKTNRISLIRGIKNIFILSFFVYLPLNAQQGTESLPLARFSFSTGLFFPQDDSLKTFFETKNTTKWEYGLDFGTIDWQVLPSFKLSTFKFSNTALESTAGNLDSLEVVNYEARLIQLSAGLLFPVRLSKKDELVFGWSATGIINTEQFVTAKRTLNFAMSVGYYRAISRNLQFICNTTYTYRKSPILAYYANWSGLGLTMGLGLNLAGKKNYN